MAQSPPRSLVPSVIPSNAQSAPRSLVPSIIPINAQSPVRSLVPATIPINAQSPPRSLEADVLADGIDGRQLESRTLPADRHILQSLTSAEIGTAAINEDELAAGAVTPAKLDRSYQEALGTLSFDTIDMRDITAVTPTSDVEVNDEDAKSFPDGSTTGVRVSFEVPDNYDSAGTVLVYIRISPSTSFAGDFRTELDWRKNGGALQGAANATVTPSATADDQNLVLIKTFSAATLAVGDGVVLTIKRIGADAADTHTGAMQLFRVVIKYAV